MSLNQRNKTEPKIAIVHEWLVNYAGSEQVLEYMLQCFPKADLFAVVDFLPLDKRQRLKGKTATTTFIQRLPFAQARYRSYLPLMPLAIEQLDLSRYDLIISSSHAVAKGVLTGPDQLHISYVHSPMRYAWDLQNQYLHESGLDRGLKSWIARWLLHKIRIWDVRTANGVDFFIANSKFIARRINKIYRREARVIYPPVETSEFIYRESKEDFYLTASRLVPYKKVNLIVEAFASLPADRLVVIGDGPDFKKVMRKAGSNVEFLGYQPRNILIDYMQRAKAFIFAAEEDFGIVPVEAQACGTPVIAYGKGGVTETIKDLSADNPTGLLFKTQSSESIIAALQDFEQVYPKISPSFCRENALKFSTDRFIKEFSSFITDAWQQHRIKD